MEEKQEINEEHDFRKNRSNIDGIYIIGQGQNRQNNKGEQTQLKKTTRKTINKMGGLITGHACFRKSQIKKREAGL